MEAVRKGWPITYTLSDHADAAREGQSTANRALPLRIDGEVANLGKHICLLGICRVREFEANPSDSHLFCPVTVQPKHNFFKEVPLPSSFISLFSTLS